MKTVHATFLTILLFVIGLATTASQFGYIRGPDAVLNIGFVGVAWFAFGASWQHRAWPPTTSPQLFLRVAPMIYWTATILTVGIPFLSLGAFCLITKYAPQRIDGAMAEIMTPTPPTMPVTTVTTASIASVPGGTTTQPYVAVFRAASEDVSPALPILKKVLDDIDSDLRSSAAWYFAGGLLMLLFFLWVVEMAVVAGRAFGPQAGATEPPAAPIPD